jgi:hypothetical protein
MAGGGRPSTTFPAARRQVVDGRPPPAMTLKRHRFRPLVSGVDAPRWRHRRARSHHRSARRHHRSARSRHRRSAIGMNFRFSGPV